MCKFLFQGLAAKIIKVEEGVYWVPSANEETTETYYEVIGAIGWCSCPIGKHGAFCKHQALAHKQFGDLFPNMPPINGKMRHELGKLALGKKCPQPSFFLEANEAPFEVSKYC